MRSSGLQLDTLGALTTLPGIACLVAFSFLYFGAVIMGLEARIGNIALIWPANGVAFCFFILRPKREWPAYIAALSLGYIVAMQATGDYPWSIILGVLLANIIQTVVGAGLVKRFVPAPVTFSSVREIIITLFCTALLGSLASAIFSVAVLGAGFMETPWQLWVSGVIDNAGSTVVTLPLLMVFFNTFSLHKWRSSNLKCWVEGGTVALITILLAEYIFSLSQSTDVLMRTLPYLLIPCILWAGLRFGQQGATLAILIIAVEVVSHTLQGEGPFATNDSGFMLVLTVHMYLSVITITGLIVAALIKQQAISMHSLAGGIAHEMRNPLGQIRYFLNTIRNTLRIAESGKLSSQMALTIHAAVDSAEKAINRSSRVIDRTLDSIHEKEIDRATFDYLSARASIEKAINEYSFDSPAERKKVSVDMGQDFVFKGDEALFIHILFNLLKNALYYLTVFPTGNITIKIRPGDDVNRIIVRDNGPGISASTEQHLFDDFFTVGKKGGTGLGLAYCKRVMRAFAGDIKCESTQGVYTAFIMSFPVVSAVEIASYQKKLLVPLENKHILIAADDTDFIHQLVADLRDNNLNITLIDDAQLAVLEMKKQPFDLVVMDLNMPGTGGLKAIRWIRNRNVFSEGECLNHKTIPIMAFSSEPELVAKEQALAVGANTYLRKDCQTIDFVKGLLACVELAGKQNLAIQSEQALQLVVVDDDQINRVIYRAMLEPHGIKVLEANSGNAALALLEQYHCDAIITDLHMPGMDGWQLAKAIRVGDYFTRFQAFASIPIIAVSGNPSREVEAHCFSSGIHVLLKKPVDSELLLETLITRLKLNFSDFDNIQYQSQGEDGVTEINPIDEALARFLHDAVKPQLTMEAHIELLECYLPTLIDFYRSNMKEDSKDTGKYGEGHLTDEAIANLQSVPAEMTQAIKACRKKLEILRSRFENEQAQDEVLTKQYIQDIAICWRWISTIQRTCLAPCLIVLLAVYEPFRENQLKTQIDIMISDDHWRNLNCVVPECADSVSLMERLFNTYENEATSDLNYAS